jgi:uncharacterized protein YndB with AHSA1/START domain
MRHLEASPVLLLLAASALVVSGFAAAQSSESGPLVSEGIIPAPPAEVWKAFATAEGYRKLGVAQCEMDLRVGGLIRSHYDRKGTLGDEGTIQNEILAFEPERMISIRVQKPPKGFPFSEATWKGTWSVITLTDLGGGSTHVRIAGLGYPDTPEGRKMREFFQAGNAWVMSHLKKQYDASASAPASRAHPESTLAPVSHERIVEIPRAEAWELYATGEGWKRFFDVRAAIELWPRGKFEIAFSEDAPAGERGSEGCEVLSFVPGEMISHTWNAPPKFKHARGRRTWVVVRFEEVAPGRTRIRIDHLGFEEQAAANAAHRAEWEQVRGYFAAAWGKVLDAIKEHGGKK